jgi:hypothetical protein
MPGVQKSLILKARTPQAWHHEAPTAIEAKREPDSLPLEIEHIKQQVAETVKAELLMAERQLDAYRTLLNMLPTGVPMPPLHGWPVSPDFAALVVERIAHWRPDTVIEFGSGSSTLFISLAIAADRTRQVRQFAFEHLEKFAEDTRRLLNAANLSTDPVKLTPLLPCAIEGGGSYLYYDCKRELADAQQYDCKRILVVVDGPPGITGRHARYPALPLLLSAFPSAEFEFLIDDHNRTDEQEMVEMWVKILHSNGRKFSLRKVKMEKDACLLSVHN